MIRHASRHGCPYHWCAAVVEMVEITEEGVNAPYGVDVGALGPRKVIVAHEIENPFLSGTCPASLMYYPFDLGTYIYLNETRYNQDSERIEEGKLDHIRRASRMIPGQGMPPNQSQSARQPGRMGREPDADSDDWGLGGREDEDTRVQYGSDDLAMPLPDDVEGHAEGKHQPPTIWSGLSTESGGTGMTSIPELAAQANSAIAKLQEAHANAETTRTLVKEAIGTINLILSNSTGETVSSALHAAIGAANEQDSSMNAMGGSVDQLQQFISNLHA